MPLNLRVMQNTISIIGGALVTLSAVLFLIVFLADLFGLHTNPYLGIVFFLILPGVFIFGLLLMPIGAWRERRRLRLGRAPRSLPRIDFNDPVHLRAMAIFLVLSLANIVIVSLAS